MLQITIGSFRASRSPGRMTTQMTMVTDLSAKRCIIGGILMAGMVIDRIAPDGEHHMVLFVGDDVLDNLTEAVGPMRYQVVRVQSAANPDIWSSNP